MNEIQRLIEQMDPWDAADILVPVVSRLINLLPDERRSEFIMKMIGESGQDKVISLVHL